MVSGGPWGVVTSLESLLKEKKNFEGSEIHLRNGDKVLLLLLYVYSRRLRSWAAVASWQG